MTKDEAKERIEKILAYMESLDADEEEVKDIDALEIAIKALEQEPCDDAISRTDVKKYLSAPDANGDRVIYESDLDLLPPVTPQEPILDKIRAEIESQRKEVSNKDSESDLLRGYYFGLNDGLKDARDTIDKYTAE